MENGKIMKPLYKTEYQEGYEEGRKYAEEFMERGPLAHEQKTLRDEYAMSAIRGLTGGDAYYNMDDKSLVESAFKIADLAIKIRKIKP